MCCVFSFIGSAVVAILAIKLIIWLHKLFSLYLIPRNFDPKKYGQWSVITGATSGIGYHLAENLAKKGSNIVIIGRKVEILEQMKKEFEKQYKVSVKIVIKDFVESDYQTIQSELNNLDIGVLVNNVGISHHAGEGFLEVESYKLENLLKTNCLSCAMMTKIVLPGMIQRKKGIIVNVGSGVSYFPFPYLGIYPASKKFVEFMTDMQRNEFSFSKNNIFFHCINPMFVATKMSKMKPSFTVPSAEAYARSAVETFDYSGESSGCLIHFLMASVIELLPYFALKIIIDFVMGKMRKVYLKRRKTE